MIGLLYQYFMDTIFYYDGTTLDDYTQLFEYLSLMFSIFTLLLFFVVFLIGLKYLFNRAGYWGWR